MLDEEVKLKTLGEQERNLLKNKSPFILPDNPSEKGFNANQIKRTMYEPILLLFDWLKKQGLETAEIIELIKNAFNNLETKVHDRGVALELDETNGIVKLIGKDEKGNNVVLSSIDLPFDTQINLINKYFTIDNDNEIVTMLYEYRVYDLTAINKSYFQNGFYSNTTESGDTYSKGLSVEHDINQFSMFGYDYNYTDGTYYTNRFNFENGGNVRVAINNPTAKFTYNDKEVATEQDVAYLEKKIRNLQASAEGSTFVYEEDSEIAYEKLVPEGTSPYAVVNKVGGMSYANENLYQYNNYLAGRGLTITENKGVITLNGTPTESGNIRFDLKEPLTAGSYTLCFFNNSIVTDLVFGVRAVDGSYLHTGLTSTNVVYKYTTTKETSSIFIGVNTSMTFNNFTFKPMLVKGSTAPTKFVPYFEGIRNSAVTNIVSQGQNLFNLKNETRIINGTTATCNNGSICFAGKTSSTGNNRFDFEKPLPAGTYTLSLLNTYPYGYTNGISTGIVFGFRTLAQSDDYKYKYIEKNNDSYTFTTKDEVLGIFIGVNSVDIDLTGLTLYPMVTNSSTPSTKFKNYKVVNKSLPSTLLNLTDYGLGIDSAFNNYIDFERKVYVRNCAPFYVNGTESSIVLGKTNEETGIYEFDVNDIFSINGKTSYNGNLVQNSGIPNYLGWQSFSGLKNEQIANIRKSIQVLISKDKASTVEEFRNWLKLNPITGVYAFNTPIEEDISYLLKDVDEFIEVEELGSITFENEFEQNVPSTITYQVKI